MAGARGGVTNEHAWLQHRSYLEASIKGSIPIPPCPPGVDPDLHRALSCSAEWVGRYARNRDAIEGRFDGPLADVEAKALLIARHRARDAAVVALPAWTDFVTDLINMSLTNTRAGGALDVRALSDIHSFGPSLRALWAKAKRAGNSDDEAWHGYVEWGRHRPASWGREDARRKRKQALVPTALAAHLGRAVGWDRVDDLDHPWTATVDGARWRIRLNDFPDEFMYSLLVGDASAGDFHDWPPAWTRPAAPPHSK